MSSDFMFGWDLTYKTVERDVSKKEDVLVAFIHWFLVKRGFRCIGVGEERTLSGNEIESELLPDGWNPNEYYALRYLLQKELYILNCSLSEDGNLLSNLMKVSDLSVSNVTIHNIDKTVIATSGEIDKMIPTYKDLIQLVLKDLVDSYPCRGTRSSETQTSVPIRSQPPPRYPLADDPLRVPLRRPSQGGLDPDWNSRDPFSIGRSDLDPLGVGGGGMIFNPFSPNPSGNFNPGLGIPGGLPRGAVPPGARFDPMGPAPINPPVGRRPPPDADHLPPPGFDDMYM